MFNEKANVCVIHAGLECGLFAEKLPELDMISIGPDMKDIHTPSEKLNIKSVEKVWKYLSLFCVIGNYVPITQKRSITENILE